MAVDFKNRSDEDIQDWMGREVVVGSDTFLDLDNRHRMEVVLD